MTCVISFPAAYVLSLLPDRVLNNIVRPFTRRYSRREHDIPLYYDDYDFDNFRGETRRQRFRKRPLRYRRRNKREDEDEEPKYLDIELPESVNRIKRSNERQSQSTPW